MCLVAQSCLISCDPVYCSLPGSSVHGDSSGKNTGVGCHFLLQGIFLTTSPALAGKFFTAEPPGKPKALQRPKKTGVQAGFELIICTL